jgi:hypothetical protein
MNQQGHGNDPIDLVGYTNKNKDLYKKVAIIAAVLVVFALLLVAVLVIVLFAGLLFFAGSARPV